MTYKTIRWFPNTSGAKQFYASWSQASFLFITNLSELTEEHLIRIIKLRNFIYWEPVYKPVTMDVYQTYWYTSLFLCNMDFSWIRIGIFWVKIYIKSILRGHGGFKVDFHFFVVSDRGECQLSGTFFGMKNIVPCQSDRILKSQKYMQLHCTCEL